MEMDLQLSLFAIGVACATAIAVYFVSVIGIREKSFEEAIAEQKKRSDDLLGSHHHHKKEKKKVGSKDKSGSKKLKKRDKVVGTNNNVGAGGNERVAVGGSDLSDDNFVGNGADGGVEEEFKVGRGEKRNHVEIVEEPEMIMEDDDDIMEENGEDGPSSLNVPRTSSRRSSVSSLNTSGGPRRDSIIKPILLNKDEISHVQTARFDVEPANNFEAIHPKDDCELRKERAASSAGGDANDGNNVSNPPSPRFGNKSSGSNTPVDDIQQQDSPQVTGKKGRALANNKQRNRQLDEEASMTAPKVEKIIERVSMTSSEIQSLIDVLLNKQHAGDSEWINKGKGSEQTVAGLKKQLELKDKMLTEEQTSVCTLQNKLKELRNEISGEKNKFAGVRRQLEDQVQAKLMEVQNLSMRLRQIEGMGMQEKGELQKQLQLMQMKFKEIQDENEAIKTDYGRYRDTEQSNRSKADALERESGALKTQCGHLENQLKGAFASNQEMSNRLLSLQEHVRAVEERKKNDELVLSRKLQERESVLLNELAAMKATFSSMETENSGLRNQVNMLESNVKGIDEVNKKFDEVKKSEVSLKNVVNELKGKVGNLEDEVQGERGRSGELERECCRLREAVEDGKKAIAAESGKVNGEVGKLSEDMRAKEEELKKLAMEVQELRKEVDEKKGKNDELRHKNQKLLESLQVTEQSLQTRIEVGEKLSSAEEERKKRVAPVLKSVLEEDIDLSKEDWLVNVLTRVQEKISGLQKQRTGVANGGEEVVSTKVSKEVEENTKRLEDEVVHYQGMLKQTENMLSTLQASLNVEESKWVAQSAEKDKEIERLQSVVLKELRGQVEEEKAANADLARRCSELEARVSSNNSSDNTNSNNDAIEELKKSNETLRAELESARIKHEDLSNALAKAQQHQNSTDSNSSNATTTSPAPITNGSTNNESISSSNDNSTNTSKSATTSSSSATPPVSPTKSSNSNASSAATTPQQLAAPPSPSTISAASSSPPAKEKKKKKARRV